jgi:Ca2+-binding EF-hand superfamily protein
MKKYSKYAMGAVLVAILGGAAAVAFASPNAPAPLAHQLGRSKIFQKFDVDHDGKVTRQEVNKVLSERFAAASGGGSALSELQFANMRLGDVHKGSDRLFEKADWNADGKVSREEFLSVEHVRFNRMDRRASGEVSCTPRSHAAKAGGQQSADKKDAGAVSTHRHFGSRHARGKGFCAQFDANKDGKVTRAEFDTAANARFDKVAKSGGISRDGFYQMAAEKVHDLQTRRFTKLDANHDGKLTLGEFEAQQKQMFARLDKNNDGAITKDEIMASRHHRFGGHGGWHKDGKPGDQSPG